MKFWQMLSWMETDQLIEVAKFAEELGFEGVMNGDHGVFPRNLRSPYPYSPDGQAPMNAEWAYPDCWVSMAAMAAVTERLKFASAIYVLPIRNPLEVAKSTGTLAIMSNNRLILGAGVGWMKEEFEAYGVDFHTRGKRMNEMIEILRRFWRGGPVDYDGEIFQYEQLQIEPAPGYTVPIFTGGSSPAAIKRAARLADGWIGNGHTPEEASALLAELARLRREAGREDQPFESVVALTTPPDLDTFKRLRDQGMTAGIAPPFLFSLGKMQSTLDEKKRAMEEFAKQFIRPLQ